MMSSPPILSSLNVETQMYPVLTAPEIERARPFGEERAVAVGEILFRPGDVGRALYILLSTDVEITQVEPDGERHVTTLTCSMFTGEAGLIAGHRAVVLARALRPGQVLEIKQDQLRALVARDGQLSEIFLRAFILRRLMLITGQFGNVVIIGSRQSMEAGRLRGFLERNGHPYTYLDLDTDPASKTLFDRFGVSLEEMPVVICNGNTVLRKPSTSELADYLGMNDNVDLASLRDLIVIGAGPAGLAAAVYAASEGLDTLILETHAPGGQAGLSSKIENYPGFPTGITGQELATNIATQAHKFGARMSIACSAVELRSDKRPYELVTDQGNVHRAKTIVVATGARYNKPATAGLEKFTGRGVHFAATYIEAQLCVGEEVVVVGGGNSAGQAAMFLSETAKKVYMLVRSSGLSETMSQYLIQRVSASPIIELVCNAELTSLHGDDSLQAALWTCRQSGAIASRSVRHIFVMAGASPNTDWLRGQVALDSKGFILTGRDLPLAVTREQSRPWPLSRPPHMLESSLPGVFVVGDVRAGSIKRVASAVGEGAISVSLVHRALAEL